METESILLSINTRILTLEVLISSIFDELVENELIDKGKVDKRVSKTVKKLNKQIKEMQNLQDSLDNLAMFMSTQVGEA